MDDIKEEKPVAESATDRREKDKKGFVPFEVFTFEDLEKIQKAEEVNAAVSEAGFELQLLTENIVVSPNISPGKKPSAMEKLAKSFGKKINSLIKSNKDLPREGFNIIKGKDGKYYWISLYSNNALDDDVPQEIISSKSHRNYVKMVDAGEVPFPELWMWHTKEWKIGQATWVGYDEGSGVAMAAGYFDDCATSIAKSLRNAELLVSHGMYGSSIQKEGNTINAHVTYEISPLPPWAAANKFTGFVILNKEATMLSSQKRDALIESIPGIVLGDVTAIESANAATSKKIDDEGIARKETSLIEDILNPEPDEEAPAVEEAPAPEKAEEEEAPATEPVEEEVPATEEVVEVAVEVTIEEEVVEEVVEDGKSVAAFSEAQVLELKETFEAFSISLVSQIEKSFSKAVSTVTEEREKETEEIIQETPLSSLKDILGFGNPVIKGMSASRSDETIIDGRKSLARSKPEENVNGKKDNPVYSGDPIINDIAEGIFNFKELMVDEQPVE